MRSTVHISLTLTRVRKVVMAIYAFGSNGSGQLGLNRKDDTSIPIKCDAFFRPLRVEAGGNHTLIISASNDVYISGEMRDLLRDPQDPNACTIFRALGKKATFCSAAWGQGRARVWPGCEVPREPKLRAGFIQSSS